MQLDRGEIKLWSVYSLTTYIPVFKKYLLSDIKIGLDFQ